jgi:hypothetical protein
MRVVGTILLVLGALLGCAVGIGMLFGVTVPGVSWLVAVGLVKLTLMASGGLMAVGAVVQRLARRTKDREQLRA